MKTLLATLLFTLTTMTLLCPAPRAQQTQVPAYIIAGLQAYEQQGYEAAVKTWLTGSPFENATAMASRIAFFKNIEKLYGQFLGYDLVFNQQTATSSRVYIRMNFQRTAGYILFTSMPRQGQWVLTQIDLDRLQKYGSTVPVLH